jgi:hypothetical protein
VSEFFDPFDVVERFVPDGQSVRPRGLHPSDPVRCRAGDHPPNRLGLTLVMMTPDVDEDLRVMCELKAA